jgi:GT2 family glycosyltransferase
MTTRCARVGVLILNWNGWRDTIECLESVFRASYPAGMLHVVVCDNGSTDGSVQRLTRWAAGEEDPQFDTPAALKALVEPPVKKPIRCVVLGREGVTRDVPMPLAGGLTIIENGSNLGFAGGNNVGLSYLARCADIDYVCILNNDIVVHPDAISTFVRRSREHGTRGVVGGTLYEYHEPDRLQAVGGGRFRMWQGLSSPLMTAPLAKGHRQVDYVSGGFALVPRPLLEDVGPMPEQYFLYGEDVDYSLRMRHSGATLAVSFDARGWHKGGASVGYRSPRHDYYVVRNGLEIVRRHSPGWLPVCAVYLALRCGLPKVARGQWSRIAVLWRGYHDFATGTLGRAGPLPGE